MAYEFVVRELRSQPTMSIRQKTSMATLGPAIGEFLGEVWQYVEQQGGTMTGPPFTRYHAVDGDDVELEAGLPVAEPLPGAGRITAGRLPGGETVATMHTGPYEGLPAAGAALDEWTAQHGRTAAGPNWEIYWSDPGETPDPAEWKTEVIRPLRPHGD